jgi:serine phosphatase RsbU (regulator of sigma subunit)
MQPVSPDGMSQRVRYPFALKLALALALLAVTIGIVTRALQYPVTRDMLMDSMRGRLADVGHTGSFLFDADDRAAITRLTGRVLDAAGPTLEQKAAALGPGGDDPVLDDARARELMQTPEFLSLVQKLRAIKMGSTGSPQPLAPLKQIERPGGKVPQINFVYLFVPIPGVEDRVIFLADSNYETADENGDGVIEEDEEGNPIGNLYYPEPFFVAPFKDKALHVAEDWYQDQWGTFLSAAVPLLDADGRVIAVLGVDYLEGSEGDKLRRLRRLYAWLTVLSVFLSALAAWGLARWLTRPVASLKAVADQVAQRNFDIQAPVLSGDELGQLARGFNQMIDEVKRYAGGLERMVDARTAELAQANAAIGELNAQLKDENRRMGAELEVAHRLQAMVLPRTSELRALVGFDVAACMFPATEVGGDYFDLLTDRDGTATLAIGDVSGHGLDSGVVMLMVQSALRALTLAGTDEQKRQYELLNLLVCRNCARIGSAKCMTLTLIDLDISGRLTLVGQHESPLLVRADGRSEWIETQDLGLPLGLDEDIGAFIGSRELMLEPDDLLVLYTDGITEAENGQGEAFGTERLQQIVVEQRALRSGDVIEQLLLALREFSGSHPIEDDVSLLVVKRRPD